MENRIIDDKLVLVPYYPNYETALKWYQDKQLCKQADNIDYVYTLDRLKRMYEYLSTHGDCFYIEYEGVLIGDISLRDNKEISILAENVLKTLSDLPRKREWIVLRRKSTPLMSKAKKCLFLWDLRRVKTIFII